MATGTNPELSAEMHGCALAQLGLRPDTPVDEARRKLLKQLGEMDFMPPVGWESALRASRIAAGGDQTAPALLPARRAAEESLRAEVEEFAAKFFSLAPNVRIARYRELQKRCTGVPALVGRLGSLGPALELPSELPSGPSREAVQLLEEIVRLFVRPGQERAGQRWRFVKSCQADPATWRVAATAVQSLHVRHAALEPTLLAELCMAPHRERLRARLLRRRKAQLWRGRVAKRLFGGERKRLAWVLAPALVLGLTLGYLKESGKPRKPEGSVSQPSWRDYKMRKANEDLNKSVNDSLREEKPIPETLPGLYLLPSQKSLSPPPARTPSPEPAPRVEVRTAKSMEEAQEMIRQLQASASHGGPPKKYKVQILTLNLEQVREKLRELREQQMQAGPDPVRDAMISGLEKAIKEGSQNSQKQP